MRSFFASFFGTLAALTVVFAALAIGAALLVSGASVKGEPKAAVKPGSYLVFDLSDQVQDAPVVEDGLDDLTSLFEDDKPRVMQSRRVTRAIDAAAADPDIAGLFLTGQSPTLSGNSGFGATKEIRDAIVRFRAAGKPVKAWLTFAGTREYYLASAATELSLDPYGAILIPGLATQPMFFAGTFEKLGIGVQVTRVGKFKSAVEPYTRRDMSPESRLQTQKLLDDIWADLSTTIEGSRAMSTGSLQKTADAEGLLHGEDAVKAHLVDRTAYLDEVIEDLRKATGVKGAREPFKQVALADYARLVPASNLAARRRDGGQDKTPSDHEKIAIVYAEGAIADGHGSEANVVWGDVVSRQLRDIRRDDTVKGVVLRVNSPGGSATASETIQREVRLMRESKPVVVSMGSIAASGGYWISTYSDRIFAEPTTITGSIGVFGLLFNVQGLATDKLGLNFETVKTGRFADALSIARPKTPEELAVLQKSVDWLYAQFLAKVAESRHLDVKAVDEIAQGRVWSGSDAARIGLVDEIGGLDAAVAFAASKAMVGEEFSVVEYPQRKPLVERLTDALTGKRRERASAGAGPIGAFVSEAARAAASLAEYNDPHGFYARLPFDFALR